MQTRALSRHFALLVCSAALTASAQSRTVERPTSVRPPLEAAANSLGMERGVRRDLTSINGIYFVAKGKMQVAVDGKPPVERKLNRSVFSMSYFIPAVRTDLTWPGPDGKPLRNIQVANGKYAWNETEPGIGATSTTDSADERLRLVWLTPQGAVRAMVDARAKDKNAVRIQEEGGRATLSTTFQGAPLEISLDASHRPVRVHWSLPGNDTEMEFSGYKDWEILDVYFPQRLVQRVNGKVVLDLTVTEFRSNPYVVFPIPAAVKSAART